VKLNHGLGDESGRKAFYNVAIPPWMNLTADGQVIWPADGGEPAYFLGLRAQSRPLLKYRQVLPTCPISSACLRIFNLR
jgi:hypothetical protein